MENLEYDLTTPKTPEVRWRQHSKTAHVIAASPDLLKVTDCRSSSSSHHSSGGKGAEQFDSIFSYKDESFESENISILDKTIYPNGKYMVNGSLSSGIGDDDADTSDDEDDDDESPTKLLKRDFSKLTTYSEPPPRYSKPNLVDQSTQAELPSRFQTIHINRRPYDILKVIGQGTFSRIYRALDKDYREIIIKIINIKKCTPHQINDFVNEVNLMDELRKVCSNHVIRMFDCCQTDAEISIVMERGEVDLHVFLHRAHHRRTNSPSFVKFYTRQILSAIQTLHSAGIIHLDIKPANFVLVAGVVKIIDFGLAMLADDDMTIDRKKNQEGTMNYMSPEILDPSLRISDRSDVWSFAVVLHEFLHAFTPFIYDENVDTTSSILKRLYEPHCLIDTDPVILKVLEDCLQLNPKKRPTSKVLLTYDYFN